MTEDNLEPIPDDRLGRLRYSITNLWDMWGRIDSVALGLAINVALALVGVVVYLTTSGWLAFAGAVWAMLNFLGPLKWVLTA